MRNKLDELAECVCIRNEFGMATLGAILVIIGILSLPIQIKFILREMRLSWVFKLYLDSASEIALDVELFVDDFSTAAVVVILLPRQ